MSPTSTDRRRCGRRAGHALATALVVVLAGQAAAAPPKGAFDFERVAEKAQKLAGEAWNDRSTVPDWLLKISYDQWRSIRFRPDRAVWHEKKLPFEVQLFHPGLFYNKVVRINVISGGKAQPLAFSPSLFDYGQTDLGSRVPQDLGFAGFRLHYPINRKDYLDEVIVFLGATYFRSLGKDGVFGLSARGLAIDTAESRGEEFPYFREFWLEEPAPHAKAATVYALLDSPRVTGAYQFVITPGDQTTVQVRSRLFLRDDVGKLGIAPMTSMFFHGENTTRWFPDFRPEVHDSDGLLLNLQGGEWLWRPVDNPKALSMSSFRTPSIAGFGLMQRDRDFASYQDLETRPERRPSVWVVPDGTWGPGRVELIEIPTANDTNDNVVAYWVSDAKATPGEPIDVAYTMYWFADDATRPPGGRVLSTRRDGGTTDGAHRFVIDFVGKQLNAIAGDQVLRGVVTVAGGEQMGDVSDQQVVKNPFTGGWRLTFQVHPKTRDVVELRAFLDQGGTVLTETWSYAIRP